MADQMPESPEQAPRVLLPSLPVGSPAQAPRVLLPSLLPAASPQPGASPEAVAASDASILSDGSNSSDVSRLSDSPEAVAASDASILSDGSNSSDVSRLSDEVVALDVGSGHSPESFSTLPPLFGCDELHSRQQAEYVAADFDHLCALSNVHKINRIGYYLQEAQAGPHVQSLYGSNATVLAALLHPCRHHTAWPELYLQIRARFHEVGYSAALFDPPDKDDDHDDSAETDWSFAWQVYLQELGARHPALGRFPRVMGQVRLRFEPQHSPFISMACDLGLLLPSWSRRIQPSIVCLAEVKSGTRAGVDDVPTEADSLSQTPVDSARAQLPTRPVARHDVLTNRHFCQSYSYLLSLAQDMHGLVTDQHVRVSILTLYGNCARVMTLTTDRADSDLPARRRWPPAWPSTEPCGTLAVSDAMDVTTIEGAHAFEAAFAAVTEEWIRRYAEPDTPVVLGRDIGLAALGPATQWTPEEYNEARNAGLYWLPSLSSPDAPQRKSSSECSAGKDRERKVTGHTPPYRSPVLTRAASKRKATNERPSVSPSGSQTSGPKRTIPVRPPSWLDKFKFDGPPELVRLAALQSSSSRVPSVKGRKRHRRTGKEGTPSSHLNISI